MVLKCYMLDICSRCGLLTLQPCCTATVTHNRQTLHFGSTFAFLVPQILTLETVFKVLQTWEYWLYITPTHPDYNLPFNKFHEQKSICICNFVYASIIIPLRAFLVITCRNQETYGFYKNAQSAQ